MLKEDDPSEENYIGDQLSLDNENVKILYEYVTSGVGGTRITKFATTGEVDLTSFSNKEKVEYALQFAQPEDFVFTGKYTDSKQKIYSFSDSILQKYLKLYFGQNATCNPEPQITFPFFFYINQKNEGKLTYNQESAGYDVIFDSRYDFDSQKNTIEQVYGKLISALRQPTGSVVLQERVVYTELRTDNGSLAVDIYKDPDKTEKLDTITGLTEETLSNFQVDFSKYPSTAIVEYTFGNNGQNLYFSHSRIII
ncbi:MAG: hypothetical protein IKF71_03925 [Bacilli bacterium]|nr:hypothetical protein [Bacilli bacterium]